MRAGGRCRRAVQTFHQASLTGYKQLRMLGLGRIQFHSTFGRFGQIRSQRSCRGGAFRCEQWPLRADWKKAPPCCAMSLATL